MESIKDEILSTINLIYHLIDMKNSYQLQSTSIKSTCTRTFKISRAIDFYERQSKQVFKY